MFDEFWNKLGQFFQGIKDEVVTIISGVFGEIENVLSLKSILQEDFNNLVEKLKEITEDSTDFADRVKKLRGKLIRAEIAFEFVEDIKTGKIKDLIDELVEVKDNVASNLDEAVSSAQKIGAIKATGFGKVIVEVFHKVTEVYTIVVKFVHACQTLVPIFEEIAGLLERYESIVLQQKNPRKSVTEKSYIRIGRLHD